MVVVVHLCITWHAGSGLGRAEQVRQPRDPVRLEHLGARIDAAQNVQREAHEPVFHPVLPDVAPRRHDAPAHHGAVEHIVRPVVRHDEVGVDVNARTMRPRNAMHIQTREQ